MDLVVGTWNRQIPLLGLPQGLKYLPLVLCGGLIVLFMIERLAGLVVFKQCKQGKQGKLLSEEC